MQISGWLIYFIGVFSGLKIVAAILGIVGLILSCIVFFVFCADDYLNGNCDVQTVALIKKVMGGSLVFLFISVFCPSKQDIAAMIVIPAVVNNEKVQGIAGDGLKILESLTKDYLLELSGENGNKK